MNGYKSSLPLSFFKSAVKAGLLFGCLAFLYYQLDITATRHAFSQYSPAKAGILSLWFLTSFLFLGVRLHIIGQGRIRLKDAVSAVFLGFFANSIFPARIGEAVKGLYLKVVSKKSVSRIITVIFWERFCDLNMILLLILMISVSGDLVRYLPGFLFIVLTGWSILAGLHLYFKNNDGKIDLIRLQWVQNTIRHLCEKPHPATIFKLIVLNFLVWAQFILEMLIAIYWIAEFDISLAAAMNVFIISSLAFAIPSSPGGVGVYDAAIVFAMGRYGIQPGDAMAFAILMRTIQYGPTLLIGFITIMVSSSNIEKIFRPSAARKMMAAIAMAHNPDKPE